MWVQPVLISSLESRLVSTTDQRQSECGLLLVLSIPLLTNTHPHQTQPSGAKRDGQSDLLLLISTPSPTVYSVTLGLLLGSTSSKLERAFESAHSWALWLARNSQGPSEVGGTGVSKWVENFSSDITVLNRTHKKMACHIKNHHFALWFSDAFNAIPPLPWGWWYWTVSACPLTLYIRTQQFIFPSLIYQSAEPTTRLVCS